ncbi:AcrR family transcriptional regulator [Arthrobacter pascens]|uniref:TetR/AcrR family transcriptional regulator n=1 Tax=Arthrobacter pascens TaxID=1677 RepID=UPI002863D7AF|nr:TetR/AcrR family transcriptional regulator [Arthrobacter pascens]MDR6557508.1 AcrR family transcriptional regulator [Arthrobacter pascens]
MTTRDAILSGALELLNSGGTVSLESAARHVGLSKPGVMHHFRTKEALMLALVDRVAEGWNQELSRRIGSPVEDAPVALRLRTYLEWCLTGDFDEADLVMLSDPRLRQPLLARWVERMAMWVEVPEDLPLEQRASLTAVRLIAEGAWFAAATDVFPPDPELRAGIRAITERLLKD